MEPGHSAYEEGGSSPKRSRTDDGPTLLSLDEEPEQFCFEWAFRWAKNVARQTTVAAAPRSAKHFSCRPLFSEDDAARLF
jgi:hypothetical protein